MRGREEPGVFCEFREFRAGITSYWVGVSELANGCGA